MAETYDKAALRHWSDGKWLEESHRFANADHLYGFAAECAIKTALVSILAGTSGGVLEKRYKEHIDRLWDAVPVQGFQKLFPGLVALLNASNAFHDWSVSHRYGDGTAVTAERFERHKTAARRLLGAVGRHGTRPETKL